MSIFARIAARYIMPAGAEPVGGRGMIFDTEADALLDAATVNHCIGVADRDSDRADEYGPDQIPAALEHLARADCLIGHNIQGYDLPLLRRLHGWAPKPGCVIRLQPPILVALRQSGFRRERTIDDHDREANAKRGERIFDPASQGSGHSRM